MAMLIGVSRTYHSREYVCDRCSSVVAAAPVLRRLLGECQFAAIWNASSTAVPGPACCFCGATMESRSLDTGRAAVCHTCQVLWFDSDALASLPAAGSVPASSAIAVSKCPNCGAPATSPLDDCCRYCGAVLDHVTPEFTGASESPAGA